MRATQRGSISPKRLAAKFVGYCQLDRKKAITAPTKIEIKSYLGLLSTKNLRVNAVTMTVGNGLLDFPMSRASFYRNP